MRSNPTSSSDDPDVVRQLIRDNPWAVLVSDNDGDLVASHYPILVDDEASELTIVTHLGRPDDQIHKLTEGELLVIVQGRHGYISPSWYPPDPGNVPTRRQVIDALREPGPYNHPGLAEEMESEGSSSPR
ncbi:MAG: FMN-binding negative transcriptional regulator [Thermoleophilia bacterium]|nr:FMN-binding negative transcriptional regulator [Thermoleophilia bacterium]